jgi:hypothetical protein
LILDTNALSAFADGNQNLLPIIKTSPSWLCPSSIWANTYTAAQRYAELRRELKTTGSPIPSNDAWIASFAPEHRLAVVTRDVHFQAVRGLHVLMW